MKSSAFVDNVNSKASAPGPSNRIVGYDLARAVAFFGMLLINFWMMMENNYSDPEWLVFTLDLIQGRAAATFVVLAGVGLSLMSRRVYLKHDATSVRKNRHVILKRALFLLIVGSLNSLIWKADILHFYAIYFVIGGYLSTVSNRRLLLLAIIPIAVYSFLMFIFNFEMRWELEADSHSAFCVLAAMVWHILFDGLYPVFPWAAFLIMGMWLGRQELSDHAFRKRILLGGIGVTGLAECLSRLAFHVSSTDRGSGFENLLYWFAIEPWDPMPLFLLSASGTSLMVVSLSIIFSQKWGNTKWILPFVSIGQSTLTLYVAHIIIGSIALKVMEVYEVEPFLFPIWGACIFYISAVILCSYWRKRFHKGPLEWLMRSFLDISIALQALRHARAKLAQPDF